MTGESRYTWKHAIQQRKYDIINRFSVFRDRRISLTFRKTRNGPCECPYPHICRPEAPPTPELNLGHVENQYVYEVYDQIADHFSDTRYKPWPLVKEFVEQLAAETLVMDVGCGNGKYLSCEGPLMLGTDRSPNLLSICRDRGFQVFTANCLSLPVQSGVVDAVISIAVVHHLST
jgi:alkylated DNA repair protein alkB family protein 8